jgi:hypothetical protein
MKSLLRERLLVRRPVLLTKEQFVADWNSQNNVWAAIDCEGYVCDACRGGAVRSFQSCENCDSTGFISLKKVHTAYRTYRTMATFMTGQAKAVEERFEKFLKSAPTEDLELVHDLLQYPPPFPLHRDVPSKVKPKLVRRIHKKTGAIARKPGEKVKKAVSMPPLNRPFLPKTKKAGGPKPVTKISSRKKRPKAASAARA